VGVFTYAHAASVSNYSSLIKQCVHPIRDQFPFFVVSRFPAAAAQPPTPGAASADTGTAPAPKEAAARSLARTCAAWRAQDPRMPAAARVRAPFGYGVREATRLPAGEAASVPQGCVFGRNQNKYEHASLCHSASSTRLSGKFCAQ
jgi:hypothetical protein